MGCKKNSTKVLILGSGTQALALVEDLNKIGCELYIIVGTTGNYGDSSKYIYKRYVINQSIENNEFFEQIKHIVLLEKIDVVIPMGDILAEFISKNKKELEKITKIKTPDYNNFLKGYDKNQLMNLCQEKGYPHPMTIDMSKQDYNDKRLFEKFPFPGLLKPNITTGGRGMTLISDYDDLCQKYPVIRKKYGECHLQRFVREGGRQVKIQLYVEEDGTLIASSVLNKVRWYPVKGGASCCSVTMMNEKIVETCHTILKDIKWEGFADFDTIEDPDTGEFLIMEINPRLPACIGASVKAGIKWGEILVRGALGLDQEHYMYKEGIILRHLGFDILWFLHSPNKYKTKPSWFHFWGKNVYYQDFHFNDQIPFWVGTYHNLKKMFDPSFRKAKSGTSAI